MTVEQKLMQNLKRACASVRRGPDTKRREHPPHGRGEHPSHGRGGHPPHGRGFGHILDLLSDGEGVSQQQIADTLGIRPQSVSEAVSVLESRGLIRKEASESDKRVTLIRITEQGVSRRNEMAEERRAHAVRFFSALTDDEKTELLRLLEKINRSFDDSKGEV